MSWINHSYKVPFVSQGSDSTACWLACVAMLMHHKQGQSQRMRSSAELCTMFRAHLAEKGVNIPGTIQPHNISWVAHHMGLRFSRLGPNDTFKQLKNKIAMSPVAIFGNYHQTTASTLMHATLAFKISGNPDRPTDLYIHGYDPQGAEPGQAYRYDFGNFHDPAMPQMSILKKGDYLMYC